MGQGGVQLQLDCTTAPGSPVCWCRCQRRVVERCDSETVLWQDRFFKDLKKRSWCSQVDRIAPGCDVLVGTIAQQGSDLDSVASRSGYPVAS